MKLSQVKILASYVLFISCAMSSGVIVMPAPDCNEITQTDLNKSKEKDESCDKILQLLRGREGAVNHTRCSAINQDLNRYPIDPQERFQQLLRSGLFIRFDLRILDPRHKDFKIGNPFIFRDCFFSYSSLEDFYFFHGNSVFFELFREL